MNPMFKKILHIIFLPVVLSCCNTQSTKAVQEKAVASVDSTAASKVDGKVDSTIFKKGTFYAYCEEKVPMPSHTTTGWCGVLRSNNDDARADTTEHSKKYPGHSRSLTICSGACPMCP
jgi:hypothetical protein